LGSIIKPAGDMTYCLRQDGLPQDIVQVRWTEFFFNRLGDIIDEEKLKL